MRRSMFGDYIVENVQDELSDAFMAADVDPEDCYAVVRTGDGEIEVEIFRNDDGEQVATTDEGVFDSIIQAEDWARSWVSDVQTI